jgi:toxin ParE1/3/4
MAKLLIRPLAENDLLDIWDFIAEAEADEINADRFLDLIQKKLEAIATTPGIGRSREELAPGLRSFPVQNYVVFYEVIQETEDAEEAVAIVRVLHGSRDMNQVFDPNNN